MSAIRLMFGLSLATVTALSFSSCAPSDLSPSYRSFMRRSQSYYAQVADACEQLAAQSSQDIAQGYRMAGTNDTLPEVLRKLHAPYIVIGTNGVGMRIGVGRGSYGLSWTPNYYDPSKWELVTNAEGTQRTVFSRRKFLPGRELRPPDAMAP